MLPVLVINPNSTVSVTERMDAALEPLRSKEGPGIECLTLDEGPPGIETEAHVNEVVPPLLSRIHSEEARAGAFVIACYSDPGLHAAREQSSRPVFGIAESAMATAITRGERFGIVSILQSSIPRHARAVRAAGLGDRFAGDVAIGVGVTGLDDSATVRERLLDAGRKLIDGHGADVLILGCAGMAAHRRAVAETLAVPVIDPTQAAVTLALGTVRLAASPA